MITTLGDLGLRGAGRRPGYPGVWIDDRKIAAIGVRIAGGRSMHGFALNVDPELTMFDHIVPCGIHNLRVTSLAAEGIEQGVDDVMDVVEHHAARVRGVTARSSGPPRHRHVAVARRRSTSAPGGARPRRPRGAASARASSSMRDAALQSGERGAEAAVHAVAEADGQARRAVDVELVGLVEGALGRGWPRR